MSQNVNDFRARLGRGHFLISAENPRANPTVPMSHEQLVAHLKGRGMNAHEVHGHYGSPERSVLVTGVSPQKAEQLHALAQSLGQESSLYSNGRQHELRYHHGPNAGRKVMGEGTDWHEHRPSDMYTTLPSGEHFTHKLNFGKSELAKAPFEYNDYAYNETLGIDRHSKEHRLVSKKVLPNGLVHKIYVPKKGDYPETLHEIHHPKLGHVGTMTVRDVYETHRGIGTPAVSLAEIEPKHRGKGYGAAMYAAVLAHHGQLASGTEVSPQAAGVWNKFFNAPGVEQDRNVGYGHVDSDESEEKPFYMEAKDPKALLHHFAGRKKKSSRRMAASELVKSPPMDETEIRLMNEIQSAGDYDRRNELHDLMSSGKHSKDRKIMADAIAKETPTKTIGGVRHFLLHRGISENDPMSDRGSHVVWHDPTSFSTSHGVADKYADSYYVKQTGEGHAPHTQSVWVPEHAISLAMHHAGKVGGTPVNEQQYSIEKEVIAGPGKYPKYSSEDDSHVDAFNAARLAEKQKRIKQSLNTKLAASELAKGPFNQDESSALNEWQRPTTLEEEEGGVFGRPHLREMLHNQFMQPQHARDRRAMVEAMARSGVKTKTINGERHFLLHRASSEHDAGENAKQVHYRRPVSMTTNPKIAGEFLDPSWAHTKKHSVWVPESAVSVYVPHAPRLGANTRAHLTDREQEVFVGPGSYLKAADKKPMRKSSEAADRETDTIKDNREDAGSVPHKFKPAKWTHPNGHPRCILCGDEERTDGMCEGYKPSLRKSLLAKAPFVGTEPNYVLQDEFRPAGRLPNEHHESSSELGNGMWHHVFRNTFNDPYGNHQVGYRYRHIISADRDPSSHQGVLAQLEGTDYRRPDKYGMRVISSAVKPAEENKGYGTMLYEAALAHHGRMSSDSVVSGPANRVWQKLKERGHDVTMGNPRAADPNVAISRAKKLAASEKSVAMGIRLEDLKKGSMARLHPYNPSSVPAKTREAVEGWTSGQAYVGETSRENIPEMTSAERARALHKLSARAHTRLDPETGKREFLLHRGMSGSENMSAVKGDHVNHATKSSWTPSLRLAHNFAAYDYGEHSGDAVPGVVSAWIPESKVHFFPNQIGTHYENMEDVGTGKLAKHPGPSHRRNEFEVIVAAGHNSKVQHHENSQDPYHALNRFPRTRALIERDLRPSRRDRKMAVLEARARRTLPNSPGQNQTVPGKLAASELGKSIAMGIRLEDLKKGPVRSPRKGHTIAQLERLKQDNWHNPDTGTEISAEEGQDHLNQMYQNSADRKLRHATSGRARAKATGSDKPEDWFGKGERGDWRKEGYTLSHTSNVHPGSDVRDLRVTAKDKNGKNVGSLYVQRWSPSAAKMSANLVEVHPEHQRKGLATAMYQHAEKVTRKKFDPSKSTDPFTGRLKDDRTFAGKKLWSQPNRPFGKGERGDWSKEGYVLRYTLIPSNQHMHGDHDLHSVAALDRKGNLVGQAYLTKQHGRLYPHEIEGVAVHVDQEHRRKGLGSAMYRLAEQKTGLKVDRPSAQSDAGAAMWDSPTRPFGKGERGDWRAEGYTVRYEPHQDENLLRIVATDRLGNKVGHAEFTPFFEHESGIDQRSDTHIRPYHDTESMEDATPAVQVHPDHRRKGLATAMYQEAERVSGKKIKDTGSSMRTQAGMALWGQQNRHFGKNLAMGIRLGDLGKSNYGPKGAGQYSQADNAKRKQANASEEPAVGSIKVKTGANSSGTQGKWRMNQQVAEAKRKSRKSPVKQYTPEEIEAYKAKKLAASEPLEKRSKNVREQTRNITLQVANKRRDAYARRLGLKPERVDESKFKQNDNNMPAASRNKVQYGGEFGLEHELAHAMQTPHGSTVREHQKYLNEGDKAGERYQRYASGDYTTRAGRSIDPEYDAEHNEASVFDENVARHLEDYIDRRAGVGGHRNKFRAETSTGNPGVKHGPLGQVRATDRDWNYQNPKTQEDYEHDPNEYRSAAEVEARNFDLHGKRFLPTGRAVQAGNVNTRMNERVQRIKNDVPAGEALRDQSKEILGQHKAYLKLFKPTRGKV